MGSPLGGFYMSALQRQQQHQFELDQRIGVVLQLRLEQNGHCLLEQSQSLFIGEAVEYSSGTTSISCTSQLLNSGLFQIECLVDVNNSSSIVNYCQTFALAPNETTQSNLADSPDYCLTLMATQA
ncbi:hypothetical protein [Shewanella sp. 6_MG-2023]|uniref:hypothetical protein n=1 Tax=Shewanella sp. 6_MG-2023 TaxID=3062660 RepID=UPI0026E2EA32|nr:hypothetical protein [Shewanella sp. 6_MG-2023]MDO6620350.1 hypothetical protein [Shewanella sp. 6_MG-2023]